MIERRPATRTSTRSSARRAAVNAAEPGPSNGRVSNPGNGSSDGDASKDWFDHDYCLNKDLPENGASASGAAVSHGSGNGQVATSANRGSVSVPVVIDDKHVEPTHEDVSGNQIPTTSQQGNFSTNDVKSTEKTSSSLTNASSVTSATPISTNPSTMASTVSTRSRRERKVPVRFIEQSENRSSTLESAKKSRKEQSKKVIVLKNEPLQLPNLDSPSGTDSAAEVTPHKEPEDDLKTVPVDEVTPRKESEEDLKTVQVDEVIESPQLDDLKMDEPKLVDSPTAENENVPKQSEEDSEDEEDSDEDYDGEDPEKEYCVCKKPHGNRFMIACDGCEDWFHGTCVNVTKKMSESVDAWICPTCRENKPDLAARIPVLVNDTTERKREDRKDTGSRRSNDGSKSGLKIRTMKVKTRIKKPRSLSDTDEKLTEEEARDKERLRQLIEKRKRENAEKLRKEVKKNPSLRDPSLNQLFAVPEIVSPTRTSPGTLSTKLRRCSICRTDRVKKESTIYCSFDCIKNHIRQFRKKAAKSEVKILEEPSLAAEATTPGSSTPMTTPDADKSLLIELTVFDAFDDKDTAFDKDTAGNERKKLKGKELLQFIIRNTNFCLDPTVKVAPPKPREVVLKRSDSIKSDHGKSGDPPSLESRKKSVSENPSSRSRKNSESKEPKSPTKLIRSDSQSKNGQSKSEEDVIKHMRSKAEELINSTLKGRVGVDSLIQKEDDGKNQFKMKMESEARALAKEIESELFALCCSNGSLSESAKKTYNLKSRTLIFNIKDTKNQLLFRSLFPQLIQLFKKISKSGDQPLKAMEVIKPYDLVRMSSEDLAKGTELAAWRKEEAKKSLEEVIKVEEGDPKTLTKKTRKGEEEITIDSSSVSMATTSPTRIKSPEKINNPLDMIFRDIDSSINRNKREKVSEEIPKSPPRSPSHTFGSSASEVRHPGDRKRSRSSMSRPKVVTVTPSLPSNIVIKEGVGGGVQINVLEDESDKKSRIIQWNGMCSGFDETASQLDPGNSKFPLQISSAITTNDESTIVLMRADNNFNSKSYSNLNVIGRIAPEQVGSYVDKLVSLREPGSDFSLNSLVQLVPLELRVDKEMPSYGNVDAVHSDNYCKFIRYLIDRKRFAVIEAKNKSSKGSSIKDLYLMPYDPAVGITQLPSPLNQIIVVPSEGDDKEKKLLLVIVRKQPLDQTSSKSSRSNHEPYVVTSKRSSSSGHHQSHHREERKRSRKSPAEAGGFTPPQDPPPSTSGRSYTPPRSDSFSSSRVASNVPSNAAFDPSFSSNNDVQMEDLEELDNNAPQELDEEFLNSYLPGLSPDMNEDTRIRVAPPLAVPDDLLTSSITDAVLNKILSQNTSSSTPPQTSGPATGSRIEMDEKELRQRALMQMKLLSNNH